MPKLPKWVTRFHRTRTNYTPAIDKQGLKVKFPNMGENTLVDDAKNLLRTLPEPNWSELDYITNQLIK